MNDHALTYGDLLRRVHELEGMNAMLRNEIARMGAVQLPCDAWDSRCTQYRTVLARIADKTAFDTATELKDMARKAIA